MTSKERKEYYNNKNRNVCHKNGTNIFMKLRCVVDREELQENPGWKLNEPGWTYTPLSFLPTCVKCEW